MTEQVPKNKRTSSIRAYNQWRLLWSAPFNLFQNSNKCTVPSDLYARFESLKHERTSSGRLSSFFWGFLNKYQEKTPAACLGLLRNWRSRGGLNPFNLSGSGPAAGVTGEGFQPGMLRTCPLTVKVVKIKYVECVLTCIYTSSRETRRGRKIWKLCWLLAFLPVCYLQQGEEFEPVALCCGLHWWVKLSTALFLRLFQGTYLLLFEDITQKSFM